MISIVLISSPVSLEARYGKYSAAGNTQPTFALVCLGAVAEKEGAHVRVIDAAAENLSIEACLREITSARPRLVGISSTTVGISASGKLAAGIKEALPDAIVIIGGCHVTALPEETLSEFAGFDMAVIGEGEETFREVIRSAEAGAGVPVGLPGTAIRKDGEVTVYPRRPFIRDLDELPLPAWHLLRGFPGAYHPSPSRIRRTPCASVVLTRGCPNRCLFCDRSVFGNRVRAYSPARAIDLVRQLRSDFGVKEILIEDDTFITSRSRVEEFCAGIVSEKIDVTWSCLGRADKVTPAILKRMREAGCWHISFGIESGDQTILDAMQKRERLPDVENAVRWSHEAGLKTSGFFILGFPGETSDSLDRTRAFALKLPLDDISIMRLTPFPGTALYESISRHGTFTREWEKMNILNTVFVPNGLTEEALDRARNRMLREFYFRPRILASKMSALMRNRNLFLPLLRGLMAFIRVTSDGTGSAKSREAAR